MKHALLTALLLLCTGLADAQSQRTEHTFKLDDPDARPAGTLDDASWLVGSWSGPAFGAMAEEVWNAPSAGSMVGMFKVYKDETVIFYELIILVEEEGSLALKVKHFNADFTAWETKEDYVNFRLVSVEEDALHFTGLSFYRINDDLLHVYIALTNNGETTEHKLIYNRTDG